MAPHNASSNRPVAHQRGRWLPLRAVLSLAVATLTLPMLSGPAYADDAAAPVTDSAVVQDAVAPVAPAADAPATDAPATDARATDAPATDAPATAAPATDGTVTAAPVKQSRTASTTSTTSAGSTTPAAAAPQPVAAPTGVAGVCDTNAGTGRVLGFEQNTRSDGSGAWVNGNINNSKGDLVEGGVVKQRVLLGELRAGENELVFNYDVKLGSLWAYDYVLGQHMDGATITAWTVTDATGPTATVHVTFFVPEGTDGTATLYVDAHIASELDHGPASGAGSISGSPYHLGLVSLNCATSGANTHQIMASAVQAGEFEVIKDANPADGTDFNFGISPGGTAADSFFLDDGAGDLADRVVFRAAPGSYTITEKNLPSGWQTTGIDCVSAPAPGYTAVDTTGAGVTARSAASVTVTVVNHVRTSCTFTNSKAASVTVEKVWTINGTTYTDAARPNGFGAQLSLTGPSGGAATDQAWGTARSGYLVGDQTTIAETVTKPDLCTADSSTVTLANGDVVDRALPATVTLGGGSNTYTVTNRLTCAAHLTLVKEVANGVEKVSAWTLSATAGSAGDLAGPTGVSGANGNVTPGATYRLSENAGNPLYVRSGGWVCDNATVADGDQVTLPIGARATCTVTNATAQLFLKKVVENNDGGTARPVDFGLTATPEAGAPTGVVAQTLPGSDVADGGFIWVRPGVRYTLSESSLPGYETKSLTCDTGADGAAQATTTVTATPGSVVHCTFTNTDTPAQITLLKKVDNGASGADHQDTEWTLSATGPATISGTEGQPAVTDRNVDAGTYTLAEAKGGPAGYTASGWDCWTDDAAQRDKTVAGGTITLGLGEDVVCEITNTAVSPVLTLVKKVVNTGTSASAVPADWTLTADGPGDAAVTGAGRATGAVPIGTYALSETLTAPNGPVGYGASAWTCLDQAGSQVNQGTDVTLVLGATVECTITNTARPGTWTVTKASTPGSGATVDPGDEIGYTVTVSKTGGVNPTDVDVVDDLARVLDNATLVPGSITASTGTASLDGTDLRWHLPVLSGTATLSYRVTVDTGAYGVTLHNVVSSTGSQPCGTGCVTEQFTPKWSLEKTAAPASGPVAPGDKVAYTLRAANTSAATVSGATVTDNLAAVLDHATMVDTATQLAAKGLTLTGTTLTWKVPVLAKGETATVSYSVVVNADAWDATLHNVATPGQPAGACVAAGRCSTTHSTPELPSLTLAKVVENGTTGAQTAATAWTLTAAPQTIPGQRTVAGAGGFAATDVLAGSYRLSEVGPGGYTASGWDCGAEPVGADNTISLSFGEHVSCTITNTATKPTLTLVKQVVNGQTGGTATAEDWTLTADGPGANDLSGAGRATSAMPIGSYDLSEAGTVPGYTASAWDCRNAQHQQVNVGSSVALELADEVVCTITNTARTGHWTVTKVSTPVSGSSVLPGETITYLLTATKTGGVDPTGVVVSDDLAGVLAHASLVGTITAPAGSTAVLGSDNALTWRIGTLSGEQTLTYTVRVADGAYGVTLRNQITSNGADECPVDKPDCRTTTHTTPQVTTLEVEKQDLETQETLAGATFALHRDVNDNGVLDAGDTAVGDPVTTDAAGLATWPGLFDGSYLVEETDAPSGYGLPAVPVKAVSIDADSGGGTLHVVFGDPAQGQLTLDKAQLELVGGSWVPSDGVVDFGDRVKYVVTVVATGPKNFHHVVVTDYVPGYNPEDTATTTRATFVPGSASCVTITCTVAFDSATGLVSWDLGTVRDQAGTAEFEVIMPPAPAPVSFVSGTYSATLWNVAYLGWDEFGSDAGHSLPSNEVRATATLTETVFPPRPPLPPVTPETPNPSVPPSHSVRPRPAVVLGQAAVPPAVLPATGAPFSPTLWGAMGGMSLLFGGWLMLAGRRRQPPE